MEMTTLEKSSNIKAIGYDPETKRMRVEFTKGATYEYHDVPPHMPKEMLQAPSAGSYFAQQVRGKFTVEKLTGEW